MLLTLAYNGFIVFLLINIFQISQSLISGRVNIDGYNPHKQKLTDFSDGKGVLNCRHVMLNRKACVFDDGTIPKQQRLFFKGPLIIFAHEGVFL